MTEDGRAQALATCKLLGLDGIVAIGGDGTFRALALAASRRHRGIPVAGIPATIDNDIGCSHYTIGVKYPITAPARLPTPAWTNT